jgi:hypothetical protein
MVKKTRRQTKMLSMCLLIIFIGFYRFSIGTKALSGNTFLYAGR